MEAEQSSRTSSSSHTTIWEIFGKHMPKSEIVFFSQVVLIYIVVITCIINLTRSEEKAQLWTALLSCCLGYLLPNPTLNIKNEK